jgi:hypothetical protein
LLNRGDTAQGTPRKEIIAALSKAFSVEEIEAAIERLRYSGVIYPGSTDDTWCRFA